MTGYEHIDFMLVEDFAKLNRISKMNEDQLREVLLNYVIYVPKINTELKAYRDISETLMSVFKEIVERK